MVGLTLYLHPSVVVKDFIPESELTEHVGEGFHKTEESIDGKVLYAKEYKSTVTTIPFLKNHELDYADIFGSNWAGLIFVLIVIFIITAVSNGANITDGIDGLAAGTSGIMGITLALIAYLTGNIVFSKYLNIMYISHLSELTIFAGAFVGACIGFYGIILIRPKFLWVIQEAWLWAVL